MLVSLAALDCLGNITAYILLTIPNTEAQRTQRTQRKTEPSETR